MPFLPSGPLSGKCHPGCPHDENKDDQAADAEHGVRQNPQIVEYLDHGSVGDLGASGKPHAIGYGIVELVEGRGAEG